jgi:hypothetical protein
MPPEQPAAATVRLYVAAAVVVLAEQYEIKNEGVSE